MRDLPLRNIFLSDFRRLEGHRTLQLDAPIVLLHGPNGTGKTSVLSGLELALTGAVRSMQRHDPRYTAHLPTHGQEFATIRVEVSPSLASNTEPTTMTVGGSRVEGAPALDPEAAQFYAERCYLDQNSLGQLLELYQYQEGKEESALARFVNELLGLEQLDALRTGLDHAGDLRRLKKLSEPLAEADEEAKRAAKELSALKRELDSARFDLTRCRQDLAQALRALHLELPADVESEKVPALVTEVLGSSQPTGRDQSLQELNRRLATLGGRIDGLTSRPSVKRLEQAKAALAAAMDALDVWSEAHGSDVEAWRSDAASLGVDAAYQIADELRLIDQKTARHEEVRAMLAELEGQLEARRGQLREFESGLTAAQGRAGSLVEGLAALREHSADNICPVCDRDFGDVSSVHLTAHLDAKISELTNQGTQLRDMRSQRDVAAGEVQRTELEVEQLRAELLSTAQLQSLADRRTSFLELEGRLDRLDPVVDAREKIQADIQSAERELEELDFVAREADEVSTELMSIAERLDTTAPDPAEQLRDAWARLDELAARQLADATALREAHESALQSLKDFAAATARVQELETAVREAAEREVTWSERVKEARRRQSVAKQVHDAASTARTTIVRRVFTESLNDVWRSVFTRLAPREPFVPAFGIPSATRTALELSLETVHRSGDTGGAPQMMLSAGNLNTAALSLFIALHLQVEPIVPCLVFDDPVQSMDEVHVAQFAGLMRVLSKHHDRQVIVAVHERALFDYLALELSPAFEGDELITIELGPRSDEDDRGVVRHVWAPDPAIAV